MAETTEQALNAESLASAGRIPRVLLLTSTLPGSGGVGDLHLRELCRSYPMDSLACFAISSTRGQLAAEFSGVPYEAAEGISSFAYRPWPGRIGTFTSLGAFVLNRSIQARKIAARVANFVRHQGIELIWSVLQNPVLYRIANLTRQRCNVPMVCTVWDPPSSVCRLRNLDSLSTEIARRDFAAAVAGCRRCGVTSETMGVEYEQRFGVKTVVMRYGSPLVDCAAPRQGLLCRNKLVIGFSGSIYASQEWDAMINTLNSVDWKIAGRKVEIFVIGRELRVRCAVRAKINFLGWRPVEEVNQFLQQVDIGYLPYWFAPSFREAVRLCFPTKLGTYLAAGIPVFFHGPADSSPNVFFERYPAGVCCNSLQPEKIVACLTQFCSNEQIYRSMTMQGRRAVEEAVNLELFTRQFRTLIGSVSDV